MSDESTNAAHGWAAKTRAGLFAAACMAAYASPAGAATPYVYANIDFPAASSTQIGAINVHGAVVGSTIVAGVEEAFIKQGGAYRAINPPRSVQSAATGVNASGAVTGTFFFPTTGNVGVSHGFIKTGSTFTRLDPTGSVDTEPAAINASGEVVGRYITSSDQSLGFSYIGGVYTVLDPFGGGERRRLRAQR